MQRTEFFVTRRDFVRLAATGIVAASIGAAPKSASTMPPIKAVAFDAFAVFDPRPILTLGQELFAAQGAELVNEWRVRQFQYCWLRVTEGRYVDFWRVTNDALTFAGKKLRITISARQRERLMNAYLELKAWPDATPALAGLKKSGYRLALLSNFTANMLAGCIKSAGLDQTFGDVLSTDQVRSYKPDPRAYQLGVDAMKLTREEIAFVAFAGWDAAGAKAFGYRTFWVNRLKQPPEELGDLPDATADDLSSLAVFLRP